MSRHHQTQCECGRRKEAGNVGCDRCEALESAGSQAVRKGKVGVADRAEKYSAIVVSRACDRWLHERGLPPETCGIFKDEEM